MSSRNKKNGEAMPTIKKRAQNDKSTELRRSVRIWNKENGKSTLMQELSSSALRRSARIQNKNGGLKPVQLEYEGSLKNRRAQNTKTYSSLLKNTRARNKKTEEPKPIKNKRARNKASEESKAIFALEIFTEILSWLPLKSLSRAQLVCKEWQTVIHDHYFLEKHMARSSVARHWYNTAHIPHSYEPDQYEFQYIDGCDGLILCKTLVSKKYYIFNPAIGRVLELPNPHDGSHGLNLVFVPSTKNYRIVSFYNVKASGRQGCEVLTPGPSMSWRPLTFPHIGKKVKVSIVSAGGVVHCVVVTKVSDDTVAEIVTLDVATECLTVNRLPNGIFRDQKKVWALNWDGKLGVADIVGSNMEVMELVNYKKQRWCEKKMIPLAFLKDNVAKGTVVPLFNEHGDIWFCFEKGEVRTYSIETGEISDIKYARSLSVESRIYPYKPSLVTVEGMQQNTVLSTYGFKVSS